MKDSNKTDWKRLEAMEDKDIDYSDIPETDADFWADAEKVVPKSKVSLTLHLDEDIAEWLSKFGDESDKVVNHVLRSYFLGLKGLKDEGPKEES